MNAKLKRTIHISSTLLILAGVLLLRYGIRKDARIRTCAALEIEISGEDSLVTQDEVRVFLIAGYGDLVGQSLDSVRIDRLEKLIPTHRYLKGGEVWMTSDGTVHVNAVQKKPIMRFVSDKESFYVDEDGLEFPVHNSYTAQVPVVYGSRQSREWIDATVAMSRYGAIQDMKADAKGNITLHTDRGRENIFFGQPEDLEEKFRLIDCYYEKIAGTKKYTSINVSFKNRIFCK